MLLAVCKTVLVTGALLCSPPLEQPAARELFWWHVNNPGDETDRVSSAFLLRQDDPAWPRVFSAAELRGTPWPPALMAQRVFSSIRDW